MNKIFLYFFILFFVSCNNIIETDKNESMTIKNDIVDFSWLEGVWVDTNTFSFSKVSKHFIEKWDVFPDSLSGVGIKVINYDTTIQERMCIRKINNKLFYIARPRGKAMLSFKLDTLTENKFSFYNKANDFPQNIEYNLVNKDSMSITLSGVFNEDKRGVRLHFRRNKNASL